MPKWKQYFKNNKEVVDYLTKILNENSDSFNINIQEDLQFLKMWKGFKSWNLEEKNHCSGFEINASCDEITENKDKKFYMGKDKVKKWKIRGNHKKITKQ